VQRACLAAMAAASLIRGPQGSVDEGRRI
jgi:hypothetical protein